MIKLNSVKNFAKSVFKKAHKTNYELIEKTEKLPIETLPHVSFVPEGAKYYTYVRIGRKDNPRYFREITSFYDEGNVLSRHMIGSDISPVRRIYDYSINDANRDLGNKYIYTKFIKTEEFDKSKMEWMPKKEEEMHTMTILDHYNVKKKVFPKKLHINKNVYHSTEEGIHITATISEYPENLCKHPSLRKKELGLDLLLGKQDKPIIIGTYQSGNAEFPLNDEMLPYRFLLGEQKLVSLTKHYLREKGLGKLNLHVAVAPDRVAENSGGHFDPKNGEILYKKAYKYTHPVKAAAHEPEHAYQFSLIGRIGKGYTEYEKRCRDELGGVESLDEYGKAVKYTIASENYPKLTDTENLAKNIDYTLNELELGSKNAEKEAMEKYNVKRKELLDQFKYVPDTVTF